MAEIVMKKIDKLIAHPMNEKIYGKDEDVSELKEEIRKSGKVVRLVITPNDTIISGHRRVKACTELVREGDKRFEKVECEVVDYDTEDDEVADIILYNKSRVKTLEQTVREAKEMLEMERAKADGRMKSGVKSDPVPTLAQGDAINKKGKSRDIIAEQLGLKSGQELDRVIKAIDAIDELVSQNREEDAALIRNVLNNGTASAAEKLAKYIDEFTDEDKQNVLLGKTTVNKIFKRIDKEKHDEKERKSNAYGLTQKEWIEKTGGIPGMIGEQTPVFDKNNLPYKGSVNRTGTFWGVIENIEQFEETFGFIVDWVIYMMNCNKDRFIKLMTETRRNVSDSVCDPRYIGSFAEMVEIIKKIDKEANEQGQERLRKIEGKNKRLTPEQEEIERKRVAQVNKTKADSLKSSMKSYKQLEERRKNGEPIY